MLATAFNSRVSCYSLIAVQKQATRILSRTSIRSAHNVGSFDSKINGHRDIVDVNETTLVERFQAEALRLQTATNRKITASDVKEVDEIHVGGAEATQMLISSIQKNKAIIRDVLDLGSGLGGPVRAMANRLDCNVQGIDLMPDMVECAKFLSTELSAYQKGTVSFVCGNILNLSYFYEESMFDVVTMIHVGMNVKEKALLFSEIKRVLRPEGIFAVYDIMMLQEHEAVIDKIKYPLAWASDANHSFLETSDLYVDLSEKAGFTTISVEDKGDMAKEFFQQQDKKWMQQKQNRSTLQPKPAFSMSLVMGADAKEKVWNLRQLIDLNVVAPVEIIFKKP